MCIWNSASLVFRCRRAAATRNVLSLSFAMRRGSHMRPHGIETCTFWLWAQGAVRSENAVRLLGQAAAAGCRLETACCCWCRRPAGAGVTTI